MAGFEHRYSYPSRKGGLAGAGNVIIETPFKPGLAHTWAFLDVECRTLGRWGDVVGG